MRVCRDVTIGLELFRRHAEHYEVDHVEFIGEVVAVVIGFHHANGFRYFFKIGLCGSELPNERAHPVEFGYVGLFEPRRPFPTVSHGKEHESVECHVDFGLVVILIVPIIRVLKIEPSKFCRTVKHFHIAKYVVMLLSEVLGNFETVGHGLVVLLKNKAVHFLPSFLVVCPQPV